jgi:hypothetical protein
MTRSSLIPEWQIHFAICDYLEIAAHPDLIWFHPANGEKRNIITARRLKRMGVKAGIPDLVFVLPYRDPIVAFMEIKSSSGVLTSEQRFFRQWCILRGVRHEIVRNVEEASEVLRSWGALKQFNKGVPTNGVD